MSGEQKGVDARPAGSVAGVSLAQAKNLLARSRFFGRLSALLFILASVAVVDSLQTLIRHEFNAIGIVPGESMLVSGAMPVDARTLEDLEVSIEGDPGLSFKPLETYQGFWFGGRMWRAELSADPGMRPGRAVLTVKEIIPLPGEKGTAKTFDERDRAILFGGQQNPALVFGITVWSSAAERLANDTSLVRRLTGFPAFGAAMFLIILAVAMGVLNWKIFSKAETALAGHGVFFIHGIKDMLTPGPGGALRPSGYRAAFARADRSFARGEEVVLLDRAWKEQSRGRIMETDAIKGYALFPQGGVRPKYGWLVRQCQTNI